MVKWLLKEANMPAIDKTNIGALALHYAAAKVSLSPDFSRFLSLISPSILPHVSFSTGLPGLCETVGRIVPGIKVKLSNFC